MLSIYLLSGIMIKQSVATLRNWTLSGTYKSAEPLIFPMVAIISRSLLRLVKSQKNDSFTLVRNIESAGTSGVLFALASINEGMSLILMSSPSSYSSSKIFSSIKLLVDLILLQDQLV